MNLTFNSDFISSRMAMKDIRFVETNQLIRKAYMAFKLEEALFKIKLQTQLILESYYDNEIKIPDCFVVGENSSEFSVVFLDNKIHPFDEEKFSYCKVINTSKPSRTVPVVISEYVPDSLEPQKITLMFDENQNLVNLRIDHKFEKPNVIISVVFDGSLKWVSYITHDLKTNIVIERPAEVNGLSYALGFAKKDFELTRKH